MRNCIIFGCGFYGKNSYEKLSKYYNILCYADNNPSLVGGILNGKDIIAGYDIESKCNVNDTDIIICTRSFMSIYRELKERGVKSCYAMVEGFLYLIDEDEMTYPFSIKSPQSYIKRNSNEKNILFVQNSPCTRTLKISRVMKKRGYRTLLLYTMNNNKAGSETFDEEFVAFTMRDVTDFIESSEIDVVHCSNEPDILACLLNCTGKKIIYDCHDMLSMCGYTNIENYSLEYLANSYSDGVIYTDENVYRIACKKFNIENRPYLVLKNYVEQNIKLASRKQKLSSLDGKFHLVYEGGMSGNDPSYFKYFDDIFVKFANSGIHIHYYSQGDEVYLRNLACKSKYLHYEGNLSSDNLVTEMTKYDFGLAVFNVNDSNRTFIETASANKIYEYINAGIPVITGGVRSYKEFVENFNVGFEIDMNKDLMKQIVSHVNITVPENFLDDNMLTFESRGHQIEDFYERVINT